MLSFRLQAVTRIEIDIMSLEIDPKIIFCLEMGYNGVQTATTRYKCLDMSYKGLQELKDLFIATSRHLKLFSA